MDSPPTALAAAPVRPGHGSGRGAWLAGAALAAVTFLAFLPALSNGFVDYDDQVYVTENPVVRQGLTWQGFLWALRSTEHLNWFPLTWLSHMLDVQLFGLAPAGHHLTSVLLHAAGAVALFALLRAATGALWRSALVAGLFALHPLRVESVAWVAERKDVLGGLLWMLTLAAYLAYARRPGPLRYAVVAAALALGLMTKPVAVTLPAVLLLLDFWPLGRWRPGAVSAPGATAPRRLLLEKAPLLALAAGAATVTLRAQQAGGAISTAAVNTLSVRLANATLSYLRYLGKAILPADLSPYYPFASHHPAADRTVAAAAALAALTGAALWLWRRRPALLTGWLWYLGTFVPMIGIVQVGNQAFADRYTYIPLIGVAVAAAWTLAEIPARARPAATAVVLAVLVLLGGLAAAQARHWHDTVTLFRQALRVEPGNVTALVNLGHALTKRGDLAAADESFLAALRISPRMRDVNLRLGINLTRLGRPEEALARYAAEIEIAPGNAEARRRAAAILLSTGRFADAERQLREAIGLRPDTAEAHRDLGLALIGQGRREEGVRELAEALRLRPGDPFATYLLQQARQGQPLGTASPPGRR
ncbi:MAG TPA: tetratricopeptide repeat protein [bacterium]